MATSQALHVTSDMTAVFTFHLSHTSDGTQGLCGRRTEKSNVPLGWYGTKREGPAQHHRYCVRCARLAEEELLSAGISLPLKKRDELLRRREFTELCGAPIDTSKPMEVDWHEEIRLAALRARDRVRANDTQDLRDQIFEAVDSNVSATIFGSVFSGDDAFTERCFAMFVHCREMKLF